MAHSARGAGDAVEGGEEVTIGTAQYSALSFAGLGASRQRSQEPEFQGWLPTRAGERPVVWYRDRQTGRSLNRPALGRLERDIITGKVGTVAVCPS